MERQSFIIGLSLDQFWGRPDDIYTGITIKEFYNLIQAYNEKKKADHMLAASHAAWIMNCWTKKRVTPEQLLGVKKLDGKKAQELLSGPAPSKSDSDQKNPLIAQMNKHNEKIHSKEAIDLSAWEDD